MLSGTNPVSQPKHSPSTVKNIQSASYGPLALFALSQNIITWIAVALYFLSGCQCPVMVTERYNIASSLRMILEVVREGPYMSKLVHMDVASADRLAQHDMHITEQISNR
eukprot:1138461-Pelagomonas_calceolata.AAC.1